ncbi:MAG: protein kinase domain-containing protein, partial [Acidimicrobiia bacterium]
MHTSAKLFTSIGQYKILDPLGAGEIGEVYRARDTRLGRTVAITMIRPDLLSSDERREQFLREARAALTLSHPNIA